MNGRLAVSPNISFIELLLCALHVPKLVDRTKSLTRDDRARENKPF